MRDLPVAGDSLEHMFDVPAIVDWDSTLAGVLATGPGPTTATVLTTIDPTRLSGEQRGDLVRAWEAQIGFAQAAQAGALAALAGEPGPHDDVVRAEVGALLVVAGVTA